MAKRPPSLSFIWEIFHLPARINVFCFGGFSLSLTTQWPFIFHFPQLPSLMTLWSAAEESVWLSRWPKTASTGAVTAPPLASWRWTSLNCWETANMRWGKQVSSTGKKIIVQENQVIVCVWVCWPTCLFIQRKRASLALSASSFS